MTSLRSRLLDVQQRLEYALLRTLVGLVRLAPLEFAGGVSARAWRILAPRLSPKRHRRAMDNLSIAFPEKSEAERREIALAHWANLGRVMVETMQIDRLLAQPERIRVVSQPLLDRYKDKLGAAVGVSLHMGNWELAIWPLTAAGSNPAGIYRTVKNPYVDQYLRDQRKDLFPGGMLGKGKVDGSWEQGQKTARFIMDFVRNGGRLGLVADLFDKQGLAVPFFGTPAPSTMVPAMIARRVGARIWLARCVRVGNASRFDIEVRELKVPRTRNQGEDIRSTTNEMQRVFEAWIREAPEQWMWSNRRWS
ncbi:MAG: lysophospholipid acyltransferase family protein [Hyphomicrobiaceae bacterium]